MNCPTCSLLRVNLCSGCTDEYQSRCFKNYCDMNCGLCGGGRHTIVPACCGRSPSRRDWEKVFEYELPLFHFPSPDIKNALIPVIFAQIAKYSIPEQFPEIDCWAVPVHKVMNCSGKFRSSDLKDYLGLPKERKLLLSTCAPDDYMEMLWERGDILDYQKYRIDYWFPAHFSIYDNDSKFYQFYNARRQMIHAARSKSQFAWFRLGENIPVEFFAPIRNVGAIIISCQQMYTLHNRAILQREVEIADRWFPLETKFFFVGYNGLRWLSSARKVFVLDERWIMLALKGRTLDNKSLPTLSIRELLIKNLKEAQWKLSSIVKC